ncbi:putative FBD-associated F-box protein At5g53635 [Pyrus x bretschneideri]|uniref:putative FBD-associated F-box protein At5g53635 n=1 Tax=Pyrus x bretschneideri TaxID=225117 RepID=UPI00202DD4FE|nr:putative FBD-associated F-box protein At5g53635 [Pyrus x bretschneideri]
MADRFSNLPKEIAHHILSFLSFKDLTQVGSVSKRSQGFCLSTPFLNDVRLRCSTSKGVLNSIDKFLRQRGDNKMLSFHFSWRNIDIHENAGRIECCFCDEEKFRLSKWIEIAVRCNVEVVDLWIASSVWYPKLPTSLFLCPSLRSLVVINMECYISDAAASLDFSSNLEYVNLSSVVIVGDVFWKWISHCCRCLKDLHLYHVYGLKDVNLESSSLESFSFVFLDLFSDYGCSLNISGDKIENVCINLVGSCYPSKKSFKFSTPNLKHLQWLGNFGTHVELGKLAGLERAEISSTCGVVDFDVLFCFLRCIRRVRVLIVNDEIVKTFSMDSYVPLQLDGVCDLSIQTLNLNDGFIPALVALLRGMPSLRSLSINARKVQDCGSTSTESNCSGFAMGYWKLQNLAFISEIQEVALQLYHGSNAVEFARYILEHAPNLGKMAIYHFPDQLDAVLKLQSTMISSAPVSFHEVSEI